MTEDGNEHLLSANYTPAISPTVSLNITKVTFTQTAIGGGGSSGHSWSSFHNSTHLSSHADFTAVFRHCLGNYFGQGPDTLGIGSLGYIWETLLGKAPLPRWGRNCESAQFGLSSMTSPPTCHLPILPQCPLPLGSHGADSVKRKATIIWGKGSKRKDRPYQGNARNPVSFLVKE